MELIWNDASNAGSTRPAQVILHLRKVGDQTDTATQTLTSANEDPNNANRWTYTFLLASYNSSDSYEVYASPINNYTDSGTAIPTLTGNPSIKDFTVADSSYLSGSRHYVGDIDYILNKYNGNYYFFTRTSSAYSTTALNALVAEFEERIGESITIANYLHKANGTQQGGDARISYKGLSSNNVYFNALATQEAIYYGTLSSDSTTRATITNTLQTTNHSVSYQFAGSTLPPNYNTLLPMTAQHSAGATVTVASDPTATGYRFLGWQKDGVNVSGTSFTMPNSDVTITGSWEQFNGYFTPTISMQITNSQTYYRVLDTVTFAITVTNPESYAINNVVVDELLSGVEFVSGTGYTVVTNQQVNIPTIAANSSVTVYARYTIPQDVTQTLTNTVEISDASAANYYYLDPSHDYEAEVDFDVHAWQDEPVVTGVNSNSTTLYYVLMLTGAIGAGIGVVSIKNKKKITKGRK